MPARLRTIIGVFGTSAALALAAWLIDWPVLLDALRQLSWSSLSAAAAFSILTTLLLALRWAVLAAAPRARPRPGDFANALVAFLFNIFTPAALGADAYRVSIGRESGGRARTMGLVGIERLIGISAYGAIYLAGYVGTASPAGVFTFTVLPFVALTTAPIAILGIAKLVFRRSHSQPDIPWLSALIRGFMDISLRRASVVWLISVAAVITWIGCYLALGDEMGLRVETGETAMIGVASEFARLLPISIQGIGVREATFGWLASEAGGSFEAAFALCAIIYATHFALIAMIALCIFCYRRKCA